VAVAVLALLAGAGAAGAYISSGRSTGHTALHPIPQPQKMNSDSNTSLDVAAIARRVSPATVDITSVLSAAGEEAEGTGMILTSSGEVLTNNHVIEGATKITARVDGTGRTYTVKVLGADPTEDVALVLLEGASGLRHVSIGNSSQVAIGDPVVAIGNALALPGSPTVTSGTISALDRSINASDASSEASEHLSGLLQTDAPINPGNSGGPLVDGSGQVIGMDTAAASGTGTESATDIGFAIPIDRAIAVATQIEEGRASSAVIIGSHGIMGVDVESVAQAEQPNFFGQSISLPVNYGAVVTEVLAGSPAARAGIASGDVIIAVNGAKVSTDATLVHLLAGAHAGRSITVTWVSSSGARHTASLTLEAGPAV
jgi:S1-C subfamily serine protease